MPPTVFDDLAYSKQLQAAGMSAAQAEALVSALMKAFQKVVALNELAPKKELRETENHLINQWAGTLLAQTAILVGAMPYLW